MNNFGNSGSPGGMKRPLTDPRQRLQQGRLGPGAGRGPGPGRGNQHPQQFPPPPRQQQLPMGPGRGLPGPPQQPPFGPGIGRPPDHQPALGGPGRGGFQMQPQSGPRHMGQHQQQLFPPGPGLGGFPIHQGQQAPPPPPPQRPPVRPPPVMNSNLNRMHNFPPAPPVMGYGLNMGGRGPPAPPPPRQPFQPQHQQHPQHLQAPPQMQTSPHLRHHQPLQQQQQQQQPGMMPPFHPPQQLQHQHQQLAHAPPQSFHPPNQYPPHVQPPLHNHGAHTHPQSFAAMPPGSANPPMHQQHAPVAVAAPAPKIVSTQYSQAQVDQAWSEHTNNGVKYYFNSILKTSTYQKPDALINPREQLQAQATQSQLAQTQKAAEAQHPVASRVWTEYTDATSGKKYYSNGVATTWEKPNGFVSPAAIVAQSVAAEEAAASATQETAKKKRKLKDSSRETPFRNSEEAVAAFKGLLLAKGVPPTQKWNDVVKMCSSDARWDDCEAVLTTGERKQALAEYQTKRFNELKEQERLERVRAKEAFNQLLSEALPKIPGFSVLKTRFSDIRDSISKDDRFYAVPTEDTRASLFLDFCEERRKQDERKKRNKKRDAQDAFCNFLKEKEEEGKLSFSSTWNTFVSSLIQSDRDDSRFMVTSVMTDPDRQLYFADFVIELQAAEDDKRRRIRDARRRAEKAQRDAYKDLLERIGREEKLAPSSHWRDVERIIEGETAFVAVLEQDRDAPRELFEEFIYEWNVLYRRDRQFLSQLVHPSSKREILVTKDTKYDAFAKALLEEASNSPQAYAEAKRIAKTEEPCSSARVYFNELQSQAREKAAMPFRRRILGSRRSSLQESSSEDEGEILEEGEVEDAETEPKATDAANSNRDAAEGKEMFTPDNIGEATGTGEQESLAPAANEDSTVHIAAIDNGNVAVGDPGLLPAGGFTDEKKPSSATYTEVATGSMEPSPEVESNSTTEAKESESTSITEGAPRDQQEYEEVI